MALVAPLTTSLEVLRSLYPSDEEFAKAKALDEDVLVEHLRKLRASQQDKSQELSLVDSVLVPLLLSR